MSTVNNTTGTGSTATDTSNSANAARGLQSNYQDFLKLLTTQLKNQDPTAPTDTNQLTQQIATLSQVEQTIQTNKNLEQLISMFSTSQLNDAVSYIGKQIDADGNQGVLSDGKAAFVYNLEKIATSADVTITNALGETVFSGSGTTLAGRNEVIWNGVNNKTGEKMPDGTYSVKVTAKDASGAAVAATTQTTGTVVAADMQNGVINVSIGDVTLPVSKIKSVRTAI